MAERKFIRNLSKPGSAAVLRENVSAAVRHTTLMVRPQISEPIDYEGFTSKYREVLQNDPQRELLLFPMDDFTIQRIPRPRRTARLFRELPNYLSLSNCPLYVRDSIDLLSHDFSVLQFRHAAYSGSWVELQINGSSKVQDTASLEQQVYELDEQQLDSSNLNGFSTKGPCDQSVIIVKEGFIMKSSEAGTDSIFSIATKSLKRRWMSLRQELLDGTSMLEFHKDQRKVESKGAICLDFCSHLVKNSRKGKFAFELRMTEGHKTCLLVAENESDYDAWIERLEQALQHKGSASTRKVETVSDEAATTPPLLPKFGTLRALEQKQQSPELFKLAEENDYICAQKRKENRLNICTLYPDLYSRKGTFTELGMSCQQKAQPAGEKFGIRFLFTCNQIEFNLKAESGSFVEPLFTTVAIYDSKRGKLTEEFKFDINDDIVKEMLPRYASCEEENGIEANKDSSSTSSSTSTDFSDSWIMCPRSAIFALHNLPSDNLYLVMRIEKVFSGSISSTSEAYLKSTQNGSIGKLGIKLQKSTKVTCQKMIGHLYRMPFAWSAKPLFKNNGCLDTSDDFGCIYRQDSNKLSDEDLLKHLNELRHSEKLKNITQIPGRIKVTLQSLPQTTTNIGNESNGSAFDGHASTNSTTGDLKNVLNSSHMPIQPFSLPTEQPATIEVQEFLVNDPILAYPFSNFTNLLYIFPKHLKYDVQKLFPKAKNICCAVEFRNNDDEAAAPLQVIFGSPGKGEPEFVSRVITSVTHHNNNPEFYEEIKLLLPTVLSHKHHLRFSFYHVSSSSLQNKKKETPIETVIGYAWMPIYPVKGRLAINETTLSISSHLPPGYLSYKPLGLNQGYSGPEIKWLDGGKESFKVDFRLVSSIFPKDPALHSFFVYVDKMLDTHSSGDEDPSCVLSDGMDYDTSSISDSSKRMSISSEAGREISKFVQIQNCMPKILKTMQECEITDLIRFFSVLMSQLLKLLITTTSDDVAVSIIRSIIHILTRLNQVQKLDIVESYVHYIFNNDYFSSLQLRTTLHEEMVNSLVSVLRNSNVDFVLNNKLLAHCGFFFRICIKSMVCHLLETNRCKMHRRERFPASFHNNLNQLIDLLMPIVMKSYNVLPLETKSANQALGHFIARCFSVMDRGYVFKLIKLYLDKFHAAKDSIQLHMYKFEFLAIVTSYEHYVPLNLPINLQQVLKQLSPDVTQESPIEISDEFCRNHFLTGVLLKEVRSALSEVHQVRGMAISVLRNLIVKHSIDNRYQPKFHQSRISYLYFPFISLLQDNLNRIYIPGFVNSYLPLHTTPKAVANTLGGSVYNLNEAQQSKYSTLTSVTSRAFLGGTASKRISITSDKFNSLNSETSSILVQSLKRNSSLEGPLGASNGSSVRDSGYLNLIAGTTQLNARILTNELVKYSKSTTATDGHDETDDTLTLHSLDIEHHSDHSRSISPYSRSSNSSTTTLTAISPTTAAHEKGSNSSSSTVQQNDGCNHQRSHSLPIRFDRLNSKEVRDLLITFLWINKNANEDLLVGWFQHANNSELIQILTIIEMTLHEFKYKEKHIAPATLWKMPLASTEKAMTLPTKISSLQVVARNAHSSVKLKQDSLESLQNPAEDLFNALLESNLNTEVGLICLDMLGLITNHLQRRLDEKDGDNQLMKRVFHLYLTFFNFGQSEKLLRHLFSALRLFVQKFTLFLFAGNTEHIGRLCLELLRFCSSRLSSVRSDASVLLYLLLKQNFMQTKQTITRMHLQLIISISQLLGNSNIDAINNPRFQESLSMINNYASSDKSIGKQSAKFNQLVKELIKNIRTVLTATLAMLTHANDYEKLLDLQHHLADSYKNTSPALRRTWLESMANHHEKNCHFSEAAQCYAHIAALEHQCLRICQPDVFSFAELLDFCQISPNIARDERLQLTCTEVSNNSDVFKNVEQQFSEKALIQSLERTIELLARAERFEIIPEVYKFLIPFYEQQRNHERLARIHKNIADNYEKIVQLQRSGKRFLGKYYRVGFYGKDYFGDDSGKEFIYKEEKVTSLSEISQRLGEMYGRKHGASNIKLIQSERDIDENDCDPCYGYIQITHVIPYDDVIEKADADSEQGLNAKDSSWQQQSSFLTASKLTADLKKLRLEFSKSIGEQVLDTIADEKQLQQSNHRALSACFKKRQTPFECENNIRLFVFETPFCLSDPRKARSSSCEDQAKKRTLCKASSHFPYVVNRIPICEKRVQELSPIEVAIDEMQARVAELREVIVKDKTDLKWLHLKLGGSLAVQVNAGPLAYAKAFINDRYPEKYVSQLRNVYCEFVQACEMGLEINEQLIGQEQQPYHESLKESFNKLLRELEEYQITQFDSDDLQSTKSLRIFDYISGQS